MNTTPLSNAEWLAPDIPCPSPIISRVFHADKTEQAVLYVTGLGYFEARLNGKKLGCDLLSPNPTDYEPRDFRVITYPCRDRFTHRIYYKSFDLAGLLRDGENLLEIQLGGGWFVQNERIAEGEMSFGDRVKCIYSLAFSDRTIVSDGSETWQNSEIVYSNLFIGEIIDPNVRTETRRVTVQTHPDSVLCPEIGVPDREIRTIKPKKCGQIYDIGENVSGYVRIKTKPGYRGTITIRFSEEQRNGALDLLSTGADYTCATGRPQIMTDTFICDGTERIFEPKFVWHCFRYFDIEGEFADAEAVVVHSDVAVTAGFESDSEGCNFLFDAYIRTELDSMHGSFPSDCPHRERLGYTGDGQITAPTAMLLLDSREFYRKWIRDILDCQDPDTGHIQHTAPFMGGGGGPGGWGSAVIIVPYHFWKNFGETDILREAYPAMEKWIGYLIAHSENSLVVREEEGGWCLGDWSTLDKCVLPEPLVNSYYLVRTLGMMREIADVIGERFVYDALEADTRIAIKQTYFTGDYDKSQGRLVYGAALGMVSADACADYYDSLGYFDTGFLATDILCELLFESGHGDVFGRLIEHDVPGTYLYMKRNGATTIWEWWHGSASHCHPMFGAPARQLFNGILGIRPLSPGFEEYEIKPQLPASMHYAKGFITTPRGKLTVEVRRTDDGINVISDLITAQ
ncbi:MAG: family 78 glycoside hydrolase catalytic domain [Eubacteriales bacterium]